MDSSQYQQILDNNVHESVTKLKLRRGWIFQQDNDPKHRSKSTQAFMQRNNYTVLEWPSQSPDLNIIEHLWDHLKRAVHARRPSNLTELELFCKEEWSKIPSSRIQELIKSYRKRLEAKIFSEPGKLRSSQSLVPKPPWECFQQSLIQSQLIKEDSLYCHIDDLAGNPEVLLPGHAINEINCESHGGNELAMQELMILPFDPSSFKKTICTGSEGYYSLKNVIKDKHGKYSTCVGDEVGFASSLKMLYTNIRFMIGMDVADSEFYSDGK
ncbi:unnamed protein product [Ranitomeya imitator]|uniref:phosphopyruvate hydratase n=1 Tax=Ranitomeya imitator TaxID=111125 RepID=A0ABN9M364_9NEOB|nr:unnamed protein product [Ranitomeya imitator]